MFLNRVAVALLVCLGCVGMYAADSSSAPKNKKNLVISSIPENVKLIIGETNEKNYVPRVKAIHALPSGTQRRLCDTAHRQGDYDQPLRRTTLHQRGRIDKHRDTHRQPN